MPSASSSLLPIRVELPRPGIPIADFCKDISRHLDELRSANQNPEIHFWDPNTFKDHQKSRGDKNSTAYTETRPEACLWCVKNGIVGRIVVAASSFQLERVLFRPFSPEEFVTAADEIFDFVKLTPAGLQSGSISTTQAKVILASTEVIKVLPVVDKLFLYSPPIGIGQYPNKRELVDCPTGFGSYIDESGDTIRYYCHKAWSHHVSLDEAKAILEKLYSGFPFKDSASKVRAIAHLLTPYVQSLIGWRRKNPLWLFTATGPRAGKDYLAMISPILHEGVAIQDPPVEEESEFKRRITAAILSGRRFQHFANCRGELNSPTLEAAITSEFWSDRVVGSSEAPIMSNEIIYSMSYNGELPITRDLVLRARRVQLDPSNPSNPSIEENPFVSNSREFRIPNLHARVASFEPLRDDSDGRTALCRRNILAALRALVNHWVKSRSTRSPVFTSFPDWARVVGGIMLACGLGDPTASSAFDLLIGIKNDEREYLRLGMLSIRGDFGSLTAKQLHEVVSAIPQSFPLLFKAGSMSIGRKMANWGKDRHSASAYLSVISDESNPSIPKYIFQLKDPALCQKYQDFMDILETPNCVPDIDHIKRSEKVHKVSRDLRKSPPAPEKLA
jgi:hypothetical protein